jgi:ribonucleotide monophosphatase NagD (HAD superfamily)
MPPTATISELLDRHGGFLLDAFGVLIDGSGVLPGAVELIRELDRRGLPFAIVSNDASRSGLTYERKFAGLGMAVPADRFVTSGTLLPDFFRERGLEGARTCVLGTEDSREFVRAGGGVPVEVAAGMEIDAVAVCDDDGTPFLEGIERAASAVVRAVHAGRRPVLVAPNPDLIYPKSDGELGLTAGAMAVMIELAVGRKLPHAGLAFDRLGKPAPLLFTTAHRAPRHDRRPARDRHRGRQRRRHRLRTRRRCFALAHRINHCAHLPARYHPPVIQRFCFVKLLDDEVGTRREFAQMLRAQLESAGCDVVVGVPADDSAARWDISIVITAASIDAWNTIARAPVMIGMFDDLSVRAAVVKAWTFEAA